MRLVIPSLGFDFKLREGMVAVISLEDPIEYRKITSDLWRQYNGDWGEVNIVDDSGILKFNDQVEVVMNPYALDSNNKKLITKLYKELSLDARESLSQETSNLYSQILEYLDLVTSLSHYDLTYDINSDITSLFKCFNLRVNVMNENLLEQLMDYIRIMNRLAGVSIFIFPNLKYYFSIEEIKQIYEFTAYERIRLIIVENLKSSPIDTEQGWIIDFDKCIINLN